MKIGKEIHSSSSQPCTTDKSTARKITAQVDNIVVIASDHCVNCCETVDDVFAKLCWKLLFLCHISGQSMPEKSNAAEGQGKAFNQPKSETIPTKIFPGL